MGRNLFSVLITDIANIFVGSPEDKMGKVRFIIDAILWAIFVFIGGLMGVATFIAYESDKLTMHHAGLT